MIEKQTSTCKEWVKVIWMIFGILRRMVIFKSDYNNKSILKRRFSSASVINGSDMDQQTTFRKKNILTKDAVERRLEKLHN